MSNVSFHAPESKTDQTFAENGQNGLHEGILGRDFGIIGAGVVLIGILLFGENNRQRNIPIGDLFWIKRRLKNFAGIEVEDQRVIKIEEKILKEIPEAKELTGGLNFENFSDVEKFIDRFADRYPTCATELDLKREKWYEVDAAAFDSAFKTGKRDSYVSQLPEDLEGFHFSPDVLKEDRKNISGNTSYPSSELREAPAVHPGKNDASSSKGIRALLSKWKRVVIIAVVIIVIILVVAAILLFLHFRNKD